MDRVLKQLIHNRLDAEGADAPWVYHVMAACEGRDALEQQLAGTGKMARPKPLTIR